MTDKQYHRLFLIPDQLHSWADQEAVRAAREEIDALRAERDSLADIRAAGDALAEAARSTERMLFLSSDDPDDFGNRWINRLAAALTGWVAARGGSEATQGDASPPEPPPAEPAIRAAVRAYLLAQFLPGEDPAELTDDTPLVTGGILDGCDVEKLTIWLDRRYGVPIHRLIDQAAGRFDSVAAIARMVRERLAIPESEGHP